MKRVLSVSLIALMAGMAPASAADPYVGSTKDPAPFTLLPSLPAGLTGLYFEVSGGPGFTKSTVNGVADLSMTGIRFCGRAGYDSPVGGFFVGAYGELCNNSDVSGKIGPMTTAELWEYGGGFRAGKDFGSLKLYALAGYAHTEFNNVIGSNGDGLKWGGGAQWKFSDHLYGKMEVTQTNTNAINSPTFGGLKITETLNAVTFGVGYQW